MRTVRVLFLTVMMIFAGLFATAATASAAPTAPAAPVQVPGTPCNAAGVRACVDLSANQAWLIRDGVVEFGPVQVSHGRKGFRTPPGTFRVSFHSRNHVSSIYGSRMPYAVFFNGGIAFHQGDLGSRSHGCIRLSRSSARTFFESLARGDVVQVVR
jgi:lipoprotein-anchoring transpeptidase ErfK/SrfK